MTKTTAQARITNRLMAWYRRQNRPLPWRETSDPYLIWVSEVMLQQTQVSTVVDYYHRFIGAFPTIQDLADAPLNRVLKLWEGLGYYARARNLHKAAQIVAAQYRGRVPDAWDEFHALPGVGDYIASAVLSIAFGRPYAVVDGNVKRVLARLFQIDIPVNASSALRAFKETAGQLLDNADPGTFNQALMELGALVCKPRQPECAACPLNTCCRSFDAGTTADFPRRKSKKPIPTRHRVAGIIMRGDNLLIVQRRSDEMLGGMWEFPGGEVMTGETPEQACQKRLWDQVHIRVRSCSRLTGVRHTYSHFKLRLDVFLCDAWDGELRLNGPADHQWVRIPDLDQYPFHGAVHKFLPQVKAIQTG